jgi:menaquinone-dependent protoporphyrinogen oxidase
MKTLIVYESKKGCTKKVATHIKERKQDAKLIQAKDNMESIERFEEIILLSPIYYGQINKYIKQFIEQHISILLVKEVTVVLCSMNNKEYETIVKTNFKDTLLDHANIIHAGGAYDFKKLNFLERFIVKKIAGVHQSLEDINYDILNTI